VTGRRCYGCDTEEARYAARVDFDFTPEYLLCHDCAAYERAWDSVLQIRSIKPLGGVV
jgi:hypothetical protein